MSNPEDTSLVAALWRVLARDGWPGLTMRRLAAEAGMETADLRRRFATRLDLLLLHGRVMDQAVLAGTIPGQDEPARDRIFDVLMRRLDAMQPHREGILRLLEDMRRDPLLALALAPHIGVAMRWMLDEINQPNVKAGWDAWSPTLEGLSKEEIRQSVYRMKPYLVMTIAADYVTMPRYTYDAQLTNYIAQKPVMRATAMGEGIVDYDNFFGALKEIGYQGYLVYEMCEVLEGGGSIENLDATAKKFLEYVKRFRNKN
jgi:sugar phosphate isomerase/epimerase